MLEAANRLCSVWNGLGCLLRLVLHQPIRPVPWSACLPTARGPRPDKSNAHATVRRVDFGAPPRPGELVVRIAFGRDVTAAALELVRPIWGTRKDGQSSNQSIHHSCQQRQAPLSATAVRDSDRSSEWVGRGIDSN